MANTITPYGKNLFADHIFHTANSQELPTTYYLGMSTATPAADGTNFTEPSSSAGYARLAISGLDNAIDGVVKNGSTLSFAQSTADQGVMTYWGIFDALTGGNLIMFDQLSKTRTVESETTLSIKTGSLTLEVAGSV